MDDRAPALGAVFSVSDFAVSTPDLKPYTFSPRIGEIATTESGRMVLVVAKGVFAVVTSASVHWNPDQVSLLTLLDVDMTIDPELVWRHDSPSSILTNFSSVVEASATPDAATADTEST